ncbi:MAG: pancreas/duodenum homeobox protein 1 [Desulfobulbaceae bacterium]|jgi:hypothetical protein|nr:pancreas/duodenum homeobox protein 1 [Desulfobulbaceae bacterium]MDY0351769.1 pancreas/duodenum homeobox protein 1 [Desulfobulbaceae bacterium]
MMDTRTLMDTFTDDVLEAIFPAARSDEFFEALFGDPSEGSYDIRLRFDGYDRNSSTLRFNLELHERPGCCLVCSLTYGLPQVFARHPVINLKGVVREIEKRLPGQAVCSDWRLEPTRQLDRSCHSIPLVIAVQAG